MWDRLLMKFRVRYELARMPHRTSKPHRRCSVIKRCRQPSLMQPGHKNPSIRRRADGMTAEPFLEATTGPQNKRWQHDIPSCGKVLLALRHSHSDEDRSMARKHSATPQKLILESLCVCVVAWYACNIHHHSKRARFRADGFRET